MPVVEKSEKPERKRAPGPPKVGPDRVEWRKGQPKAPWKLEQEAALSKDSNAEAAVLEVMLLDAVRQGKTADVLKSFEIALARVSFAEFCQQAWHVVEPSTRLEWGRHHQLICTTLQALYEDWKRSQKEMDYLPLVKNTLINTCPGSLKSRLISVFFNAFVWLDSPGWKVICISVNNDAAMRDAQLTRDLIRSDWYQANFKPTWSLKADQDAISNFGNTAGGGRISRPSGSVIVGLRADCVAGDTLVSTDQGDISIADLHNRRLTGQILPRVLSFNHDTQRTEYQVIKNTKCAGTKEFLEIRTQSDKLLRCTDDHRIYSQGAYKEASTLLGCEVSVLRKSIQDVLFAETSSMQCLRSGNVSLCAVSKVFPERWSGVRQKSLQRNHQRTVLQQKLQDDSYQSSCDMVGMQAMSRTVSTEIKKDKSSVLFQSLLSPERSRTFVDTQTHCVSRMPIVLPASIVSNNVLFGIMRGQITFKKHDRQREFKLFRENCNGIHWNVMGQYSATDSRTGSAPVSVRGNQNNKSYASSSHRPGSDQQCARKLNHSLRSVSHYTPQTCGDTVLSINFPIKKGSREKIVVYDIEVEGNHNFFANGILVHNCLIGDDLNDPHESENKAARQLVNQIWDTNQYNRVNDPLRSQRICVQQRTNALDHSGHVVAKQGAWSPENLDGWLVMCLPAEYERSRPAFQLPQHLRQHVQGLPNVELCDWRTEEGEILHLSRMTPKFLAGEKKRWAGTGNYAGQMQQRPSAEGGGKIKKKWFNFFRLAKGVREDIDQIELNAPRPDDCRQAEATVIHAAHHRPGEWDFDQIVVSVDPAYKKTEAGSLWGMLVVGCKQARKYVLDDRSQRGEPDEIIMVLKSMVTMWHPSKILIEDKAGGYDMFRTLQLAMGEGDVPMVELELVNPGTQDKEQRLNSAIPTLANGMVYVREGAEWLADFLTEMGEFPNGTHDDRVDALTQILNHVREDETKLPDAAAWAKAFG